MNEASLYERVNLMQRQDAKQIIEEYSKTIQWRTDGRDTLLDVGCGSGNVLMDFVHPILPEHYEELVGTDISEKMVDYARKSYGKYKRTNFKILDISTEQLPKELCSHFDHVTSFYCLHWVQNLKQVVQNIYDLLRPEGGDCLLVFLASNPLFTVYKTLAQTAKWSTYMADVERFIPPLYYSNDPGTEFAALLHEIGFLDYSVEIRNEIFIYEGVDTLKDNVKAICPFLERIPEADHFDFMKDFMAVIANLKLHEDHINEAEQKFISPYKLVVAYAKKPSTFLSSFVEKDARTLKGLN